MGGEVVTSRATGRPYRPRAIAVANGIGRGLARIGLRANLEEASLLAAARRAGKGRRFADESFREPLGRLLRALDCEARLHPLGRAILRQTLVRLLLNRLRLEAACQEHSEIEAIAVDSPVFIVGLQRTGTTLLHRLLAVDPALRPLASWEALNPAPFPGTGPRAGGRDPRMRSAEWAERGLRYLAPDFFAIHPVEAHAPEEDVLLLDFSLLSPTAEASQNLPSYSRWLEEVDHRPAYRYFRRMIQLLLWQKPGRWLGKTPHHLEYLDVLLDVFPDAKIIHTHRDPLRALPSFCSMLFHARGIFSDRVDPREVGRQWTHKQVRMVERGMVVRDRVGAESFADVSYTALIADPIKQVRRIYDFLELDLAPETERRMQAWISGNPQHRLGRHDYRLEDFGLDRADLERRFAAYRERFDVPRE